MIRVCMHGKVSKVISHAGSGIKAPVAIATGSTAALVGASKAAEARSAHVPVC